MKKLLLQYKLSKPNEEKESTNDVINEESTYDVIEEDFDETHNTPAGGECKDDISWVKYWRQCTAKSVENSWMQSELWRNTSKMNM